MCLKFCWGHNGFLAEFMSLEEEEEVSEFLINSIRYWIGLNDISVEGRLTQEFHSY